MKRGPALSIAYRPILAFASRLYCDPVFHTGHRVVGLGAIPFHKEYNECRPVPDDIVYRRVSFDLVVGKITSVDLGV